MEELFEKLKEAEEIAKKNKIPFFAAMVTDNDDKDTSYKYFHATPFYNGVKLTKDYISSMLLVINGFEVKKSKESNVDELLLKAKTVDGD